MSSRRNLCDQEKSKWSGEAQVTGRIRSNIIVRNADEKHVDFMGAGGTDVTPPNPHIRQNVSPLIRLHLPPILPTLNLHLLSVYSLNFTGVIKLVRQTEVSVTICGARNNSLSLSLSTNPGVEAAQTTTHDGTGQEVRPRNGRTYALLSHAFCTKLINSN